MLNSPGDIRACVRNIIVVDEYLCLELHQYDLLPLGFKM